MANCGLLLNDGSSFLELNAGGFLLLNDNTCAVEPGQEVEAEVVVSVAGVGSAPLRGTWRNWERKPLPKKKKKLLTDLDDLLVEVRARIDESAQPQLEAQRVTVRLEELFDNARITELTNAQIARQVTILRRIMQEMDDEEVLLMSIH